MQTNSKYHFQSFEHSGKEVRFHWDVQSVVVEDDPDLHYKAEEALCLDSDAPEVMLEKILAEGCDPEIAQGLVDLWINR